MVSAEDLSAVPLFSSLSDSDLRELASWFDVHTASQGVRLAGEGAAGYSFFILTRGRAVVTSGGANLATLGPGDFFGEIAILGNGRRSATVTTTSPATFLVMFGTEFRRLQQAQPEIAAHIEEAMRQRVGTPS
jgi:CRP/FNR family transcriptional regulator, cyclic AMP receptor protein